MHTTRPPNLILHLSTIEGLSRINYETQKAILSIPLLRHSFYIRTGNDLVAGLRMHGVRPPFPHAFSWFGPQLRIRAWPLLTCTVSLRTNLQDHVYLSIILIKTLICWHLRFWRRRVWNLLFTGMLHRVGSRNLQTYHGCLLPPSSEVYKSKSQQYLNFAPWRSTAGYSLPRPHTLRFRLRPPCPGEGASYVASAACSHSTTLYKFSNFYSGDDCGYWMRDRMIGVSFATRARLKIRHLIHADSWGPACFYYNSLVTKA
jgi:hypothetical protein